MAKKAFEKGFAKKHERKWIKEKIETLDAEEETIREIKKFDESPKADSGNKVINLIKKDNKLGLQDKKNLLKLLEERYLEIFDFINCPEDYATLKTESVFLAKMTQNSFLLMAQRLKKIKDGELYKKDGYNDFKTFIEKELPIKRRTAYNYIDLINFFGVQTFAHDKNLQSSKLLYAIPLLKSEIEEYKKNDIKEKFLNDSKIMSARDLKKEAIELKEKYGLIKKENKIPTDKIINYINNYKKELNYDDIKIVVSYLNDLVEDL